MFFSFFLVLPTHTRPPQGPSSLLPTLLLPPSLTHGGENLTTEALEPSRPAEVRFPAAVNHHQVPSLSPEGMKRYSSTSILPQSGMYSLLWTPQSLPWWMGFDLPALEWAGSVVQFSHCGWPWARPSPPWSPPMKQRWKEDLTSSCRMLLVGWLKGAGVPRERNIHRWPYCFSPLSHGNFLNTCWDRHTGK